MMRIEVTTHGQSGFVIAVETSDRKPGTGYDFDSEGVALVTGQVALTTIEGRPEKWTAWLWQQAGHYPPTGRHSNAIDAGDPAKLAAKLRKRFGKQGAWWTS
jgi:hypothetical protein